MTSSSKKHRPRRWRTRVAQPPISRTTKKENGVIKYSVSKDGLPKFLVTAKDAADAGQIEQAAALLSDENIEIVRRILKEDPSRTDVMFILAMLLYATGRSAQAEDWYRKLLKKQSNVLAYHDLGNICRKDGRLSEAAEYRRKLLQECPDNGDFLYHLGHVLMDLGQVQEGMDLLQKAVEKMPDRPDIHSNLLFHFHHLSNLDRHRLFDMHKRWAQIHTPITLARQSHSNNPDPDRRLRIGYISPDFRGHPVGLFMESLLDGHNSQAVEIYGYANVKCADQINKRLKPKFHHYRNVYRIDDKTVVRMIEQDKIDILVDLAGHTGGNRLTVMAYKPAPVQVSYLGYFETTGMQQIDYYLTDHIANPPHSQQFYTEQLCCLPDGFFCYKPPDIAPPVLPLPAGQKGYITFGMFGNNCKINSFIVSLWAKVLKSIENSRILFMFKGGNDQQLREHYFAQFEKFGISRERLVIHSYKPFVEYLQQCTEVDIVLDTYPYNGGTTTCDALWMGVPVISLAGEHHMSRISLSILTHLDMAFFAAETPDEYVAKAAALAAKPQALARIRATMRQRMTTSPICDAGRFARNVEAAYRKMWRKWCRCREADNYTLSDNILNTSPGNLPAKSPCGM
ncbi:MAG: O-linked N-acetylglucosamine transferase, SPINDLY family protein [Planctomycetota bacterium]|jgi:predicted O-linked N-acetylglucosamine transferase (SPINDLY family)